MTMRQSSPPDTVSSLDTGAFWREHDQSLDEHRHLGNVTLSHDLYRGMPPWFNAYYAYFQQRSVERLLRQCKFSENAHTLDVGCGTGRWSQFMLARGWKPYGIDIGIQALHYAATAYPKIGFTCGELPWLCFAKESFELVISVTVLQHVNREKQAVALQSIYQTIKPGGYLLICESIDSSDTSLHIFGNTFERWNQLFTEAGFQVVKITGSEYLPHVRLFHWFRSKILQIKPASLAAPKTDVSTIAHLLQTRPMLSNLVRVSILLSYPLEYVASLLFPARWARLGCFLLQKK